MMNEQMNMQTTEGIKPELKGKNHKLHLISAFHLSNKEVMLCLNARRWQFHFFNEFF